MEPRTLCRPFLCCAVVLSLLAWVAPALDWQENIRPKLFCSMTPRDYTAFVGNLTAEDSFTRLLFTDFTADADRDLSSSSSASGPSINTPYSTPPSSSPASPSPGLLLIGARNMVYKLSAWELRLTQTLHWPAEETARETCVVKGKTRDDCQNFIVVMQQYESDPTR